MDRDRRESIAEAAGFWDARLRAPGCTDDDRREFARWRDADPAHREAFERLQAIVAVLRQQRSRADLRAIRDAALALAGRRRRRVKWTIAASMGGLALAAMLWFLAPRLAGFTWGSADTYSTGTGQRSTVMLQDGSVVELNSRTRIHVAFGDERRSVALLEGQAIFRVAKDARRPFVVRAGDREIVAVGTAFDVRLDASTVRVTLIEGKVAVTPKGGADDVKLPLPAAQPGEREVERLQAGSAAATGESRDAIFLSPGQQLVIARNADDMTSPPASQPIVVREIDTAKVTSWRAGRVFLEDMTLAQAVAEMNRHSVIQIIIGDPSLEPLRVNGMFRAGEQQAFARALEEYFPIIAERRSETRIVLEPRR